MQRCLLTYIHESLDSTIETDIICSWGWNLPGPSLSVMWKNCDVEYICKSKKAIQHIQKKIANQLSKEKCALSTSHKRTHQCNKTVSSMNDNSFKCKIKWNFVQVFCKESSEWEKRQREKKQIARKDYLEDSCLSQQRSWWKLQHLLL